MTPTQKSQVSCNIHLKGNREKEGKKTQLTEKEGRQISGKGREKGCFVCWAAHGGVYG